ncbi:MAG: sarcosine oxidase subunit delta [Betaproteobacteria bacterium]
MLLIPCPFCGPRAHVEFNYGGDALRTRPAADEADSIGAWIDYVYLRENPRGAHREYWHHASGCRAWLIVERDTLTHEITSARPATEDRQ